MCTIQNLDMTNKTCAVFNHPAHYNESIYRLMRTQLSIDFYFGKDRSIRVKEIDLLQEKLDSKILKTSRIGPFYFYRGISISILSEYDNILLTGDPFCITNWWILLWAKVSGKRTFLWTHGLYGSEGYIRGKLKYVFFDFASHILLYGEIAQRLLVRRGFAIDKISVIYNSLNVEKQLAIRKALRKTDIYEQLFKNSNEVLIHVGRIKKEKNISLLIEAMGLLRREGVSLNLLLVGDIIDDKALKFLIDEHDLSENIIFYGACYDEEIIANFMFNASVCVSPGNVGLTAMHALVYGLPVITHGNYLNQKPEFEAVIENKTGSLFREGDVNSLSEAIKLWIRKKRVNADELSQDCLNVILDKYSPKVQINLLKKLLS